MRNLHEGGQYVHKMKSEKEYLRLGLQNILDAIATGRNGSHVANLKRLLMDLEP